jgi:hypothetical protein
MGELMSVQEIVVERNVRRIWHGVRELIDEAERLGDGELVHFLAVAQTLIEEKAGGTELADVDTSLPN